MILVPMCVPLTIANAQTLEELRRVGRALGIPRHILYPDIVDLLAWLAEDE